MYVIIRLSENDTNRIYLSYGARQLETDVPMFASAEAEYIMTWAVKKST
jgi:hypothetical protein